MVGQRTHEKIINIVFLNVVSANQELKYFEGGSQQEVGRQRLQQSPDRLIQRPENLQQRVVSDAHGQGGALLSTTDEPQMIGSLGEILPTSVRGVASRTCGAPGHASRAPRARSGRLTG